MKRRRRHPDEEVPAPAPVVEPVAAPAAVPFPTRRLAELARDNPFPELPDELEPFYFALDAGGRHLVTDAIRERNLTLMVEVGCFLCGSTRQWLESSPSLTVIGVDPWDDNWGRNIRKKLAANHGSVRTLRDPIATAESVEKYGNYRAALNNVAEWRDRFIPVRRRSPEALFYLKQRNIRPQMIYLDAYKEEEDLLVAHELFPDAILCGDDWDWLDENGEPAMQHNVQRFAADYGFNITAEAATWVLAPTGRRAAKRARSFESSGAEAQDGRRDEAVRRGIASTMLTRFATVIDRPGLRDATVLVVGCEAASVEAATTSSIARFVGTSSDPALIEQLRATVNDDRFEFHHFEPGPTGGELPIGDETFDLIAAVSTFDHLDPERYHALLKALRRHGAPGAKLAYTVLLDELTPDGEGLMDAFARSLGDAVAGTTDHFQDFLPDEPLRIALYERDFAVELLRGTGWACVAVDDPDPPFQHLVIAERVPEG